jgi:hypothetical protein
MYAGWRHVADGDSRATRPWRGAMKKMILDIVGLVV